MKLPSRESGLALYDTPKRGPVTRQLTKPANPKTPAQVKARTYLAAAASAYKELPIATAAAWSALANDITQTDALGLSHTLTGVALFTRVNFLRQSAALEISAAVPDPALIPPPYSAVLQCGYFGAIFYFKLACPGSPDGTHVNFRFTNSVARASRRLRKCELKIPFDNWFFSWTDVASEEFFWHFGALQTVTVVNGQYCGHEVTMCSSEFLPRAPQFVSQQLLEAP